MYLEKLGPNSFSKQHDRNKLHVSERIGHIFDKGSFVEYYPSYEGEKREYDGVITGYGNVCGHRVYFYGQDFSFKGGTFGYHHSKQIIAILKEAMKNRKPIIGIYDGGGARIQEGAASVAGCGELFHLNAQASGLIPQIAIIAGTCAGGAVYSPGLMDFVFTIDETSNLFVTGAKVVNGVQGTNYSIEELGGAKMHSTISGVAHFRNKSERACYRKVRKLLDLLPPCYLECRNYRTRRYLKKDILDIQKHLPKDNHAPYDVKKIIEELLDDNSFVEVQKDFAQNMVIGLGRLGGLTVGIVANQTKHKNGSIDCDSADKAARFVQYLDCYNIPIITLADSTGFVMEAEQEHKGLIRHGAKMIQAYSQATTIKLTVILRKGYGGPFIFMGCKQLAADCHYVWPGAEVAVMKAEGAVSVICQNELRKLQGEEKRRYLEEQIAIYKEKYMNSELVLENHFVDEEMNPAMTREILYGDLLRLSMQEAEEQPVKKHSNMPM